MDCQIATQRHSAKLGRMIAVFRQQTANTISLQLRVSVTVFYTYCFPLSMFKHIIDSLCVCSFHYILLIICPEEGVVKVMDSKRKPFDKWADLQDLLQTAWKRFTRKARGEWKKELTFEHLKVSSTSYIRASP